MIGRISAKVRPGDEEIGSQMCATFWGIVTGKMNCRFVRIPLEFLARIVNYTCETGV